MAVTPHAERCTRTLSFLLVLLTVIGFGNAAAAKDVVDPRPFDALLKKYVDAKGGVAYSKWKADANDRAALDRFVASIGEAEVSGGSAARPWACLSCRK